ncbi:MAG: hypothetical protein AB1755_04530 [Candidatus Omnitrophota bacterium]
MRIGKILTAGVVITIFNAIVGMLTCGGIFNWVYKIEPTNIWKPMDGPPGVMFMIGSLILSILLSFVYALISKGIPGKNKFIKGLVFGLCVWVVGILPGMLATYAFMTVSTTVVIYWTILELVKAPLQGMIIAVIYGG